MKKLLFLLPVLLLPLFASAQQQSVPSIEVDGASEIKVMPDEATINMNLRELGMKVSDVTNKLNKKTKAIEDALKKSGVKDYKFVVDNYYVNINRIYTRGSSKDSGYVATQNIRVVVKHRENDLVKIVESINKSADLSYNVSFGISENQKKSYQEKLLELALLDAKRKADIIAKTMGIDQIRVYKVNYSSGASFQPTEYRMETMMMKTASEDRVEPTFSPEEQTLSDRVNVSFTFIHK
ncbi:hypothetical protein SAMN06295967_11627 [Belliella buryatensis]|uniref:DUF541 domain-containing protein n=1 Tax=Belliella buryatensis TaxID=1500549 RepID=A0A239GII4_9BACT|nr:SIMPL domain-containing protein [Belliella buryatensis]SNS68293.1 hypothetical protein SAMN06295967_11627 [Belliella buryatensis]